MITAEPCLGRNCKVRDKCELYSETADTTHGFYTMDEGFVCEEYHRKDDPIVELDEDQEALFDETVARMGGEKPTGSAFDRRRLGK